MAKVAKLTIKNFRTFEHYECDFGLRSLVCLIGRGDSGKSTILDALSYVLSPSWSLPLTDYDFHKCNTAEPIVISAIVVELPSDLVRVDKQGLSIAGYNQATHEICSIEDEGAIEALRIDLTVDASLEPRWEVVNVVSGERKPIAAKDRSLLNAFSVSDYINRHFAWANGSPLSTLTKTSGGEIRQEALVEIARHVREIASGIDLGEFGTLLADVRGCAAKFGVETGELNASLDMKQLPIRDGAVCLHNDKHLPVRLSGKGSKRLLSVAIQSSVSGDDAITMIDEIEQGLEPDRVRSLVSVLMLRTSGQVILTTHSDNVLVEVSAENVLWVRGGDSPIEVHKDAQPLLRACPAAFFGKRVILCEGQTEYGFCRALDDHNIACGNIPFSHCGTVVVVGNGSQFSTYANLLLDFGVDLLVFCDADEPNANERCDELKLRGAAVVTWSDGCSFEEGVFADVTTSVVNELLNLAVTYSDADSDEFATQSITDKVRAKYRAKGGTLTQLFGREEYDRDLRLAIGEAAKGKKDKGGAWFKTVSAGRVLGKHVTERYDELPSDSVLKGNIDQICTWATRA